MCHLTHREPPKVTSGQMTSGRMTPGLMTSGQMTSGLMTSGRMTPGQMTSGRKTIFRKPRSLVEASSRTFDRPKTVPATAGASSGRYLKPAGQRSPKVRVRLHRRSWRRKRNRLQPRVAAPFFSSAPWVAVSN